MEAPNGGDLQGDMEPLKRRRLRAGTGLRRKRADTADRDAGQPERQRSRPSPLERFHVALQITAVGSFHPYDSPTSFVPVSQTVWDAIGGCTLGAIEEASSGAGEVRFHVRRTGALASLALALKMGALVFPRLWKVEPTLASVRSGRFFAFSAMRYALPGSPPLGVRASLPVFL